MKRFKLLLVALATVSFTAFYACGGEQKTDEGANTETEQVEETPETPEAPEASETQETEVKDSTAVENNEENAETPAEEKTEGGE